MKTRLACLLVIGVVCGCSDQTRSEYSKAGAIAGKAVDQDVAKGVRAADAASKAARESIRHDQANSAAEVRQLKSATMTPKIQSALAGASDLHSSKIHVETVGRKVTLSGTVPTAVEKHRAVQIAKDMVGSAYQVSSNLQVGS